MEKVGLLKAVSSLEWTRAQHGATKFKNRSKTRLFPETTKAPELYSSDADCRVA